MQQSHHKKVSRMHCRMMVELKNNVENERETDKMQPTKALSMSMRWKGSD